MKMSHIIKSIFVVGLLSVSVAGNLQAETLDGLLKSVKDGSYADAKANKERESRFKAEKARQVQLLADAKRERTKLENLAQRKESDVEKNKIKVTEAKKRYEESLGTLKELFGHIISTAGDMRESFKVSRVSAQYPDRGEFLTGLVNKMTKEDKLPSIAELEQLWGSLLTEMIETGKVTRFTAPVANPQGETSDREVIRVGSFNIVDTNGNYLNYSEKGVLQELARQPSGPYQGLAQGVVGASDGLSPIGVDPTGPSGGSLLAALIDAPNVIERWHQGGYVGYAITVLGFFAILIAVWRLIVLTGVSSKVNAQLKADSANPDNPLGRVLAVHESNPNMDPETLELKLSEAILQEIPKIESFIGGLKIIAAVAPLMGLLGTVTGMILTFQAITIFGAGDPKAMAGGISSALITTVLGLLVAIPTILMHTIVNARAQRVIHVLEEQSTGIIAEHSEKG